MFVGFLPFESPVLLHVAEYVVFAHPACVHFKVLGAAPLVEVPVDDFEDAQEAEEDKGLDAHYGELVPPVHDLLQGRHVCYRDQQVGADDVREGHTQHGAVVPVLQVLKDRGELGPPVEVAGETPKELVVV